MVIKNAFEPAFPQDRGNGIVVTADHGAKTVWDRERILLRQGPRVFNQPLQNINANGDIPEQSVANGVEPSGWESIMVAQRHSLQIGRWRDFAAVMDCPQDTPQMGRVLFDQLGQIDCFASKLDTQSPQGRFVL